MTAWWEGLIDLVEVPDVHQVVAPLRLNAIQYAVKQILDRTQLMNDIGVVLERGLSENRAPAGYKVGHMQPGSVGLTFSHDETDILVDHHGINPIVVKHGVPYAWGNQFHTNGVVYNIAETTHHNQGLTAEYRAFITEPLLRAGFRPDMIFGGAAPCAQEPKKPRILSERFHMKRYLQLTKDEIAENEKLWAAEHGSALNRVQQQATPPVRPPEPAQPVHPLHRALGARKRQIGLATLDGRDI